MKKLIIFTLSLLFTDLSYAQCQYKLDEKGIPHIKANAIRDTYRCWGRVHAEFRHKQMFTFLSIVHGTMAEKHGHQFLKKDFLFRLLDLPTFALKLYNGLPDELKENLKNYSEGVNSYLQDINYSHRWSPQNSVSLLLLQSFSQTSKTFKNDFLESKRLKRFGYGASALFHPQGTPWYTSILEGPVKSESPPFDLKGSLQEILSQKTLDTGSNSWVVHSSHTKNGRVILANDPHLELTETPFWLFNAINSKDHEIFGTSLPGIPVIVTGTNGVMSWGITNSYLDVADVVVQPEDEVEVKKFNPVVWVKIGPIKVPIFFKSLERTTSGNPILPLELADGKKYILKWSALDLTAKDIQKLFYLQNQKSIETFDEHLGLIGLPSWNFIFSDGEKIAYRAIGKIPKREGPNYGLSNNSKPFEYLKPSNIPHLVTEKNYIVTANNVQSINFIGGQKQDLGMRAQQIHQLLSQKQQTIDTTMKAQCDNFGVDAFYFTPKFIEIVGDQLRSEHRELLTNWDFQFNSTCKACGLYRDWMNLVLKDSGLNENALWKLIEEKSVRSLIKKIYQNEIYKISKFKMWSSVHGSYFPTMTGLDGVFVPTTGDKRTVNVGTSQKQGDKFHHTVGASMRFIVEMNKDGHDIYFSMPGKNTNKSFLEQWNGCQYLSFSKLTSWKDAKRVP